MTQSAQYLQPLTKRDLAILKMVASYLGVSTEHIQRLHFQTTSPKSTPCYRRISMLEKAGYLKRHQPRLQIALGRQADFISIAPEAVKVLQAAEDYPANSLSRLAHSLPPIQLEHHFGICDVRVSLELAIGHLPWLELIEWLPGPGTPCPIIKVTDTPSLLQDSSEAEHTLIPDGQFSLYTHLGLLTCYLEYDRGSIPKRLSRRLLGYLLHEQSLPVKRPILFVVPDQKRADTIAQWVKTQANKIKIDPGIFYLTTKEHLTELTIFDAPIWQSVGKAEPVYLVPQPQTRVSVAAASSLGHDTMGIL